MHPKKSTSGFDEFLEICIGHLSVAESTLKPWEERRISAVIRLAYAYETKLNVPSAIETFLIAIEKLKDCATTVIGEDTIKHTSLGFGYTQILAAAFDNTIGLKKEAEELYEVLWSLFKRFTNLLDHPDVLKVGGCSAGSRGNRNPGSEEELLKEILELCGRKGSVTQHEIDAWTSLALLYEGHQSWEKLLETCKSGLQRLWREIITPKGDKIYLPKEHRKPALELAYQLAIAYLRLNIVASAEAIYSRIFGACTNSLIPGEAEILTALTKFCGFLEGNGKAEESVKVLTGYFEQLQSSLSPRDERKISIGFQLAELLVRSNKPQKAEGVYIQLWTALSTYKITPQLFEVVSKLSKLYAANPTFGNAGSFYTSFFTCIFGAKERIDFPADPVLVFDIYQKLASILKARNEPVAFIKKLTDDLKKFYLANFGDKHVSYLRIVYFLAIMIEEEKITEEAIIQYQWLLAAFKDKPQEGEFQVIVIDVKKRLAALLSRTKDKCKQAEEYYRELWIICKSDHGSSSEQTIEYLKLLVQFLKGQNRLQDASVNP
ncbi:hypothetical protein TWF718_005206 [Orbilia javanica]|uniref:Uncharacterized protein n=1 Tax=Orbilia javanica TaxID=47235 RepID=A0AAN8N3U9_9PEZI